MKTPLATLLAVLLLAGGPMALWPRDAGAADDVMRLVTADAVVTALHAAGARKFATSTDSHGDPQIEAETDGISFDVLFYDCEEDECQKAQFRVEFQDDEIDPAEARKMMGKWNREWVFGKAYVGDSSYMVLEHAIYARDGVTQANLGRNVALWVEQVKDFAEAIGW